MNVRDLKAAIWSKMGWSGLDGAALVAPMLAHYAEVDVGAVADNATWYSPVYDLGEPRVRFGVLAMRHSPSTLQQTQTEIEIEWSTTPSGPWYPAPTSATGDSRQSLVVVTTSDRSAISRGQPLHRYFRVRNLAKSNGFPADTKLFLHYGAIY